MKLSGGSLFVLLLAVAGCDEGIDFCTNRNDAGECPDIDIPDLDSGWMDGTAPGEGDGGEEGDASGADASAVVSDGGLDAAMTTPDAGPTAYSVEEFCAALYAPATAWKSKFDECCIGASQEDREALGFFLLGGLLYEDTAERESVDRCVSLLNDALANADFSTTAAVGCANRYAAQFNLPPTACPEDGYAFEQQEAMSGHQAQAIVQLAECSAAVVGKLPRNAPCSNPYVCAAGLRCLGDDNSRTCRDPIASGAACSSTEECAAGLVCVGASGSGAGGRVCRPVNEPVEVTASCTLSTECRTGTICVNGACVNPEGTLSCTP